MHTPARLLVTGGLMALSMSTGAVHAQGAPGADDGSGLIDEIVVTARRRDERSQDVPVSVTVLSGDALARSSVQVLGDLNTVVPGFRFDAEGGKDNTNVSLRGLSQLPLGEVTPAVVTYFANIPMPSVGSNIPTYDIGSIQVLKGPQGTLFGRNTIGGAVLVSPVAPNYEFGGYAKASYARFDYRALEGAINLPVVSDKVAVRVAGQRRRQDGSIENLSGGPDYSDVHQDSARVSLLLEPIEGLSSTTIFDYFRAKERPGGLYLYRHYVNAIPGLSALLDPQIAPYRAQQLENFYGAFDDGIGGGYSSRKAQGISNDTSYKLGPLTLRNIFGFRKNLSEQLITGGTGPLVFPGAVFGSPVDIPIRLFDGAARLDRQYLTEEFQVLGEFDGFNIIGGVFYNHDRSDGPSGSNFVAFAPSSTPASFVSSHVENKNYAVFTQIGIDLSEQLKLNVGGRYSWDRVNACGGGIFGAQYVDRATCDEVAEQNLADGVGIVKNKGQEPSWTASLDYKVSDEWLMYLVTRRGYRGANVNTPAFETPFTTGGIDVACGFGVNPQCPDFRAFQRTAEEKLTDVELGSKWDFSVGERRGRINVAGYYSKYKNALQFLNVATTGVPLSGTPDLPTNQALGVNASDRTIWGIELETTFSPVRDLTVSVVGAYTNQSVDGIDIPSNAGLSLTAAQITEPSPEFAGTLGLSWILPLRPLDGELVFNADYYKTDDFGGQLGQPLPGYELANARIDWNDIGTSGISVGAYVRNAFDKKYFTASSNLQPAFPTNTVYVGQQRTAGVEATIKF
jgi:iron complex outermembrane recepter protein